MASISEMLSDLADFPENHPYLAEALPTIAGAVLMARRGRNGQPTTIGAPLGAGLLAGGQLLGDYAKDQTDRRNKTAQGKVIGQLNPSTTNLPTIKGATTGKGPDYASWLSSYVAAGGDPATGAKLWQDANKTEKGTYVYWKAPGKPEVALPAGAPAPGPDYYTSSFKPAADGGTKTPFELWQKDHPGGKYADYMADAAASKPPPNPVTVVTSNPDGSTASGSWQYDRASHTMKYIPHVGGDANATGGVPAKLDATEKKQVDAVRNAEIEFPVLRQAIAALPPNVSTATRYSQYAKYIAKGALGPVDPRFAEYFAQIGQLKGDLLGAASGGRQSVPLMNYVKEHIPDERDPPALALQKMTSFDEGRFKAILQNAGIKPTAEVSGATPPPAPPFDVDKTYNKDGQWYVSDKAGKFYRFDGSKWAPL